MIIAAAAIITNLIIWLLSKALFAFIPDLDTRGLLARPLFYIANSFVFRTISIFLFSLFGAMVASRVALHVFGLPIDFYFVLSLVFAVGMLAEQWQFARVGIQAAQNTVAGGTNYEKSLQLCKDQLRFLGTGASKLTSAKNFEETVYRIDNPNSPLRLLLSCPENEAIRDAALKAGVNSEDYKHNVRVSLARLAKLKKDRTMNIEVRFYNGRQPFRMMFVDDDILLLSYNAYGKGDGSQLPQQVLFKSSLHSSDSGFYFAYEQYFDLLWSRSLPWNPDDYK